jgi:hypothetical protein
MRDQEEVKDQGEAGDLAVQEAAEQAKRAMEGSANREARQETKPEFVLSPPARFAPAVMLPRRQQAVATSSAPTASGSMLKDFLLGGTSGCIAKTCCAPLERVKIVLQTQAAADLPKGAGYNGMIDCYNGILKEGGYAALWRGNVINCARYFPTQVK